jgi:hypothetical protein
MANTKATSEDKKWKAESDLSTLIEAEKIKADKSRYSAAMSAKKERMEALKCVGKEEKGEK